MMNGGGMFFGGGFMWIFWVLLLVLIAGVIWFSFGSAGSSRSTGTGETPLDILKKRYARGEIDEEEFERRRRELES